MNRDPKPLLYWAGATFLAIGSLVALVILIGQFMMWGTEKYQGYNTVTVSGTGEVSAIPDVSTFNYTIESRMKTAAEAQAAVTKQSDAVLVALMNLGIEEKDIKTEGYNSYPEYDYLTADTRICANGYCQPNGKQVLKGYVVSHNLSVKVRNLEKVGDVAALLGTAGVQNISGPSFEVDDMTALQNEARAKAIENARDNAKDLAKSLNVRLGKFVSYSEGNGGGYMPMYASDAMNKESAVAMEVPAPTLPVGENQLMVNVQVTYRVR
jgi:uncharacterized protein